MGLPDDDTDSLISRLSLRAKASTPSTPRRRSTLSDLMQARFPEFQKLIAGRTWQQFTDDLSAEGILNADGQPLTAERVRKTWWVVSRRLKLKSRKPSRPASARPVDRPPSTPPATPADLREPEVTTPEPRRQFQRSRLKD